MAQANGYERLYRLAREAAAEAAGGPRAFGIIGSTLAGTLVRSEALIIIGNQDEDTVNPARMVEFASYVTSRVVDEIHAGTI